MRRTYLLITLIVLTISTVWANPIDPNTAKNLAQTFWAQQFAHRGTANFRDVTSEVGTSNLYIFNNEAGTGFVIVAGDDCSVPILGYSDENNFKTEDMPANLRSWLQRYDNVISAAVANHTEATADIAQQWTNLRAGRLPIEGGRESVSPWLTTQWDQDAPYNNLCPGSGSTKAYTGCAATAMAQVMKFHNWPTTGTGSHSYYCDAYYDYGTLSANFGNTTYNWSAMQNTYSPSATGTAANAVATLMFHCGVAIEMMYGPNGSGAFIADNYYYTGSHASVEYALKTYFDYRSSLHSEYEEEHTSAEWKNMLKNDIRDTMPVVYSGYDEEYESGHAFVCDGFDNSDRFHFNWGWSGYGDGYFVINDLTPSPGGIGGGNYDFSYGMHAVFGIRPNGEGGGGDPTTGSYDLQMYADFVVTPTPLQQGESVSVTATIANYGETDFSGAFKLVLETSNATEVQVIQSVTLNGTLAAGHGGSMELTGDITAAPGTYKMALYYQGSDETSWSYVGDDLGYANPTTVTVAAASTHNLQMFTNFAITPNPLRRGENANVNVSIFNQGNGAFNGTLKLVLENANAQQQQVIAQQTVSTFGAMSTDIFTFAGNITVSPGTYKMALYYQPTNASTWTLVGHSFNSNLSNPQDVSVVNGTGIEENGVPSATIYPNPATERIYLNVEATRMQIYNEVGVLVMMLQGEDLTEGINISGLAAGTYIVQLHTIDGIRTQKFIKR